MARPTLQELKQAVKKQTKFLQQIIELKKQGVSLDNHFTKKEQQDIDEMMERFSSELKISTK